MINITENEKKMLVNIIENDFADGERGAYVWVWSDCLDHPNKIKSTSIPGIVSSLCKKGLAETDDYTGRDAGVAATDKGFEVWTQIKDTTIAESISETFAYHHVRVFGGQAEIQTNKVIAAGEGWPDEITYAPTVDAIDALCDYPDDYGQESEMQDAEVCAKLKKWVVV